MRRQTYRRKAFRKSSRNYRPKTTYGKVFRTRRGKKGCYKYVNGRKVAFVRRK